MACVCAYVCCVRACRGCGQGHNTGSVQGRRQGWRQECSGRRRWRRRKGAQPTPTHPPTHTHTHLWARQLTQPQDRALPGGLLAWRGAQLRARERPSGSVRAVGGVRKACSCSLRQEGRGAVKVPWGGGGHALTHTCITHARTHLRVRAVCCQHHVRRHAHRAPPQRLQQVRKHGAAAGGGRAKRSVGTWSL